jgi:hypothetical protein
VKGKLMGEGPRLFSPCDGNWEARVGRGDAPVLPPHEGGGRKNTAGHIMLQPTAATCRAQRVTRSKHSDRADLTHLSATPLARGDLNGVRTFRIPRPRRRRPKLAP